MGCSRRYPGPFTLLVPTRCSALAPQTPPFAGGLLAQLPQLDATGSAIHHNHSASHGEEENILVLGTESGLAIPTKSSMMIWTRLQQFCADKCCGV